MNKTCMANKWLIGTLIALALLLAAFAGICVYIDPFCHYHAPLSGYDYSIVVGNGSSIYLNDGIIRHFDFDGVITGTSMTENFKPSEADELFGGKFIKVPLAGSGIKETTEQLERVYSRGKTPKIVIRSLDDRAVLTDKDKVLRDYSEFNYLYNDDVFDDANYLFNLELFLKYTREILSRPLPEGEQPLDFDRYCSWDSATGKEAVLATYDHYDTHAEGTNFTPEDRERIIENVRCNITDIGYRHPETTFICFFPPYSIVNWYRLQSDESLRWTLEMRRTAAEEILKCPNIKLFGFDDLYDVVCDLDNYKDVTHYNAAINSELLKMMRSGAGQLTLDNYKDYFNEIERFYSEYDYSWLFE